jgi:lipoprotein-anchoring transpeptidase ErfK/SrfK
VSAVALLALAPSATGAQRALTVEATPTDGAAPLTVTFTAAEAVNWDFGDGTYGSGQSVQHTYSAGRWIAQWTSGGEQGAVAITAHGIELTGPSRVRYRRRATFRGRLQPAESGVTVTLSNGVTIVRVTSRQDGAFKARPRVTGVGSWTATTAAASSQSVAVSVIPQLRTRLLGSGARGSRFVFVASVRPGEAGDLAVRVRRGTKVVVDRTFVGPVRIRLDTRRLTTYVIRAEVEPNEGFLSIAHVVRAHVVLPTLGFGASGSAVARLGSRLRTLHYATPFTAIFDSRLLDAVYAFEKVQGLPRSGRVDAAFWRRLADPRVPVPRYREPADHLEIDKPHQVLYVVRSSAVALIVPVSTAGIPGRFTPTGRFAIYRKVAGFDPSPLGTLFDPMYFTGGYAIHGNPSVPPYPASHGCVRVPMWIAPFLYATNPYGETVYVY